MTSEAVGSPPPAPKGRGGKVIWWVVGLVLVVGMVSLAVMEANKVGATHQTSAAPSLQLKRHGGGTMALSDLKGQVVMLDFWATWCPPCKAEMPTLIKLAREYEAQGLAFVAVSQDEDDVAEELVGHFLRSERPELAPYIVYGGDAIAQEFKVEALPTLYFLDRDGKVLNVHRGMMDEDEMRQNIEAALKKQ